MRSSGPQITTRKTKNWSAWTPLKTRINPGGPEGWSVTDSLVSSVVCTCPQPWPGFLMKYDVVFLCLMVWGEIWLFVFLIFVKLFIITILNFIYMLTKCIYVLCWSFAIIINEYNTNIVQIKLSFYLNLIAFSI